MKVELEALLKAAKNEEAAKAALALMFPRVTDLIQYSMGAFSDPDATAGERRIQDADHAPLYFRLTPKTVVWSKSQAEELMRGDPHEAFSAFESRINLATSGDKARLRRAILHFLEQAFRDRPGDRASWLIAMSNNASFLLDRGDWQTARIFEPSVDDHVRIMLRQMLVALEQPDRVDLMSSVIEHAKDVSLLCELMRSLTGDSESIGADFKSEILGDATKEVRNLLLSRVRTLAESGDLPKQARPGDLLWYWWGCGLGDQVRDYTAQAMATDEGLRMLLDIPGSYVRSTEGNYERVDQASWGKIVDLRKLEHFAQSWKTSDNLKDAELSSRFLAALQRDNRA